MNTGPAPHQPCARRASNLFFFNMRSTRLGPAMSDPTFPRKTPCNKRRFKGLAEAAA